MTAERTEEERAYRAPLTVSVSGEPRQLRILKRRESRVWRQHVAEATGEVVAEGLDGEALLARGGLAGVTDELVAELVRSYDVDGVLGDDGLDEMTDAELMDAYRQMVKVTFPLDASTTFVELMGTFGTNGRSLPANSTSSPSPNGRASARKARTS